jgi:hypothetical protein
MDRKKIESLSLRANRLFNIAYLDTDVGSFLLIVRELLDVLKEAPPQEQHVEAGQEQTLLSAAIAQRDALKMRVDSQRKAIESAVRTIDAERAMNRKLIAQSERMLEQSERVVAQAEKTEAAREGLASQLIAMQARAANAERERESIRAEWANEKARADEYSAKLALVSTGVENVWWWQGNGDDVASLSCPVVMSVDTLRSFVGDAEERRGEVLEAALVPEETTEPKPSTDKVLAETLEPFDREEVWNHGASCGAKQERATVVAHLRNLYALRSNNGKWPVATLLAKDIDELERGDHIK